MRYDSIGAGLVAATLLACQSVSGPEPHVAASVGVAFTLAPQQRAVFDREGLEVQFLGVTADSRCPVDTTCVWAGEAKVRIAIRIASAAAKEHEILTGEHVVVRQYRVTVLRLLPEPVSTRRISPDEYRATLEVERG